MLGWQWAVAYCIAQSPSILLVGQYGMRRDDPENDLVLKYLFEVSDIFGE